MIMIEENSPVPVFQITQQALVMAETVISSISRIDTKISISSQGSIAMSDLDQLFHQQEPEVIAVSQRLQGVLQGHMLFVVQYDAGMKLMRNLLQEKARLRELTEMEEEALMELGNIIINSYLSSYLSQNPGELNSQLPVIERDHYAQILDEYRSEVSNDLLLYVQLQFSCHENNYQATLFWTGA